MLRFLLRFIGLCVLATAFFFLVYDGTKSIANQTLVYTRVSEAWAMVDQKHLDVAQSWLRQTAMWARIPYVEKFFDLPFWILLVVVAMILIALGRKRRPLIGYARN